MIKFNGKRIKNILLGKMKNTRIVNFMGVLMPPKTYTYKVSIKFPFKSLDGENLFRPVTITLKDTGLDHAYFLDSCNLEIEWGDGGVTNTRSLFVDHTYRINEKDRDKKESNFILVVKSDKELLLNEPVGKTNPTNNRNDYSLAIEYLGN